MTTTWRQARPWISTATRVALGIVLIVAGGVKLPDPEGAVRAVRAYELLPESVVPLVGLSVPVLEVALGLVLVLGLFTRLASLAGVLLMAVFIGAIGWAWARGLSIDCGCFGGGGQVEPGEEQYLTEILRDLGFLALGLFSAIWPASPLSLDRWLDRGLHLDGSESGKPGPHGDPEPGATPLADQISTSQR